ncbi:sugar transferase [Romboutsia sp.]|uniref:sugar transferase n=1 Tax=Romboutsia sp. TaxID=1965302 RepID=UPI002C4FE219|nr:sugar transferase [Romboutsia sp.]HSQ87300.1 sugar transferase [Romboutsia sp.]
MKILERFLALIMIILLSPILVIVAVCVKLNSKGPILFEQERVGQYGKVFKIYKFRTMKIDAPNVSTEELINADEFITKVGKILRVTSIDEIPQLLNIVKGDMSFVGPRPVIVEEKLLNKLRLEQGVYNVTPGITGWAQVNGRDEVGIYEKVSYDKEYIQRKSLGFDLYILFLTVYKVINRKDIKEAN